MDRFKKILRRRNQALAVFDEARKQLQVVVQELQQTIQQSDETIGRLNDQIAQEEQAQSFAAGEIATAETRLKKFDELLA